MKIYVESVHKEEPGVMIVAAALRKLGHEVTEVGARDYEGPGHCHDDWDELEEGEEGNAWDSPPVIDVLITSMERSDLCTSNCWCAPKARINLQYLLLQIVTSVDANLLAEVLASHPQIPKG